MKVAGIMLVRNEDRFVEWSVRNAVAFCDEFLICDNESSDGTAQILDRLRGEFGGRIRIVRTRRTGDSHALIESFAGTKTWVFGVDGDEVYDPAGLSRLRIRLEAGEFDRWWAVFGNVLNVRSLDVVGREASGHLAPPCRSMTKLYNFAAIESWRGKIVERLHGGDIRFRPGFDETLRLNLYETACWGEADFRCLHLCFLRRSSLDRDGDKPRENIMDRHARSFSKWISRARAAAGFGRHEDWKLQKYARGPEVAVPIDAFLPA